MIVVADVADIVVAIVAYDGGGDDSRSVVATLNHDSRSRAVLVTVTL